MQDLLSILYGNRQAPEIENRIHALIREYAGKIPAGRPGWNESDVFLITYADSLLADDATPLQALRGFLKRELDSEITIAHLLPFYPWTSDDGFSVVDFRKVNDPLGTWDDVTALAGDRRLCFDAVINHVSAESEYVQGYLQGDPRYAGFVIEAPPEADTAAVVRPRNLPLFHEFTCADGRTARLWTTFSRDQVDLNAANPAVLIELIDILLFYASRGAGMIRLDAIPYLWKTPGTGCVHLPQTHAVVRLFRRVLDIAAPHVILLTETNVPHRENISYFGNAGDEAQMIYNFTLAPLIVWSILNQSATHLSAWAGEIQKISDRATYLNITATHDGIGLRPTEGILSDAERRQLTDMVLARGGHISEKRNADGTTSPYEMNISYYDAINDPADEGNLEQDVARFLMSQTIPLSLIGIPGIYIHSLLGSRNDADGVAETGRARSINRARLQVADVETALSGPNTRTASVLNEYRRRLRIRAGCTAFHPDAGQRILDLHPRIFALERSNAETGERVIALHNVSNYEVHVELPLDNETRDLLSPKHTFHENGPLQMAPCQCRWLLVPN